MRASLSNRRTRFSGAQIQAAREGSIIEIAERGGIEWDARKSRPARGDYWALCPFHGEKSASLHVIAARGIFRCFGCGEKGDAIELARLLFGVSFPAAVEMLGGERSEEPDPAVLEAREQRRREAFERAERQRILQRAISVELVSAAVPIAGTIGARYLRDVRAIDVALNNAQLRFHPNTPLSPYDPTIGGRRPAIVATIENAANSQIGAHITFLRNDGRGKAELPHLKGSRMIIGEHVGGFIRLGLVRRVAVIGEGIESTLSASEVCGEPGLAAINSANMRAVILPASVGRAIIAHDRDAKGAGQLAAEALATRLWAEGLTVEMLPPPANFGDWNDAAKASVLSRKGGAHV